MLAFYQTIARRLYPLRLALWLVAAVCLAFFVFTVFGHGSKPGGGGLMASVVTLLWIVSALSVVQGFHRPFPEAPDGASLLARLKVRALRAFLWLMAIVMTLLTAALLLLTARALRIAMA